MHNDLSVSKIINVYYEERTDWKRDFFAPRRYDAVVLFAQGEIEYDFGYKKVTASAGDFLLLPGNLSYSGVRKSESVAYFVVDFECLNIDDFQKIFPPCAIKSSDYASHAGMFSEAVAAWNRHMTGVNLKMKSFLYMMMAEIIQCRPDDADLLKSDQIIDYITEHLGDPSLSVDSISRSLFISESQLRRRIWKAAGVKPTEYILTLRINKAKNLLSRTDKTVKAIASECGFASPFYFTRCFSRCVGLSPSEYRLQSST